MKVCTQCKIEKDTIEFPKRKSNKDGLYSWCKECCRKKTKEHALKNPEAVKASKEKRKERSLETARIYKKLHKERLKKRWKQYYEINADELKRKAREYSKNLTDDQKKARREYYLKWKETETGKNYVKTIWKEKKSKYNKHYKAGQKVQDAIRSGKLIRPDFCSICKYNGQIEGHHIDYDKPLEVIWVCRKCHTMIHKNLKKGE